MSADLQERLLRAAREADANLHKTEGNLISFNAPQSETLINLLREAANTLHGPVQELEAPAVIGATEAAAANRLAALGQENANLRKLLEAAAIQMRPYHTLVSAIDTVLNPPTDDAG